MFGDLPATHPRQHHIGQQQVNWFPVVLDDLEGSLRGHALQNSIAAFLKDF